MEPTEKKIVGSLPKGVGGALRVTTMVGILNRSKVVQGFPQMVAHLTSRVRGLDLLLLFLLSGVSYWIESNLDIVSLHGVLQPKRD